MKLALIIPAAGFSARYAKALKAEQGVDLARSKLDEDLGGRPVLHRTVELFTQGDHAGVEATALVIVAGPHDPEAFESFKQRHGDKLALYGVKLVRGGITHRYETVQAALAHVPGDAGGGGFTHIAVHDAARPCTPPELIERVLHAAEKNPAVIPALDVGDTLKRAQEVDVPREVDPLDAILGPSEGSESGGTAKSRIVRETIDRSGLVAVQTPQVFAADVLRRAYAQKDLTSTDDAQLVERLGIPVTIVEGDARNLKITRPMDLGLARSILGVRGSDNRATHKRF